MKKYLFAPLCAFALASAELIEPPAPPVTPSPLQGWIAFDLSLATLASSKGPVLGIRGGVEKGCWRLGAWAATLGSDVENPAQESQYLDYDAMGLLAEPVFYSKGSFTASLPLLLGAATLNTRARGEEEFHSAGAFLTADAGLLGSYGLSRNVRLALGGGYRFSYGIDSDGLSDSDFRSPYGELQVVYGGF